MIDLDLIRIDGGTQARAALNPETVADYAEAYRANVKMPEIVVFYDGSHYWLADGFHRFFGAKEAGKTTIFENVHRGTQRDAVLYSLGANANHGLRRTNDDKRRAVMTLLNDAEWSKWTDVAIAKACSVSSNFVGDMRKSIINPINDSQLRTVERKGTTYEQNTAKIGRREPAPAAEKPSPPSTPPAAQISSPASQQSAKPSDLEAAKDELEEAKEVIQALNEKNDELESEIKTLRTAVDPKVFARIEKLQGQIRVIELQRNDWQNQCSELKKQVKKLQRQLAKANA